MGLYSILKTIFNYLNRLMVTETHYFNILFTQERVHFSLNEHE